MRADPEDYDDSSGNGPVMTAPARQGGARAPGMPAASSLRSGEARTTGSRNTETRARTTPVTPSAADDKSGWVSDLLRRASTDEEAAAPQPARRQETPKGARPALHAIESLNSISMDIAKAIDQDAAVELWDRYRRGERNVFTRRLYTLQGQKTFDEIRSKYVREAEFRAAVDRYIADFEKLLGDVGKHDRDNMMVQTYLTSDHGKVYTMLAHAAGRLGD